MLKLELPFHLAERPDGTFLRSSLIDLDRSRTNEVILEGLRIAVETREKTYAFSSDGPPQPDHPGWGRGTIWQRTCWPLTDGMSIEQQLLLRAAGNALAVSWRLIGAALLPVRTKVRPVFSAHQSFSPTGFAIEPASSGGRLAWRPHSHLPKIIADTNGCISTKAISDPSGGVPACFEFNLGPRPAILILSTEAHSAMETDPLIGAFLAQLSEQGATTMDCDHQRNLAAA
jgi:hypothetical protein